MFKNLQAWLAARPAQPLIPESQYIVTYDDQQITCRDPAGVVQSVRWDDLQTVVIETNDLGPFAPDVFWVITGTQTQCIIPQGATGEKLLLARLQALPNFDNEALIEAMGSTENATFSCWQKPATA